MKTLSRPTTLAALAALAATTATTGHAAVLFDASADTVYLAANNAGVTSTNTGGQVTVVNGAASNQGAYIFGNFDATSLDEIGDEITLSFTITNPPSSLPNFTAILSGVRGGVLKTSDTALNGFSRAYAGYAFDQPIDRADLDYFANQGGPATNNTQFDRVLIEQTIQSLGGGSTGTGADRLDSDDTADVSLTLTRASATEFNITSTLDVVGGSGEQQLGNITFTPPRANDFQVGDAFTTFGIGVRGLNASSQLAPGGTFNFSNLTVTTPGGVIPEPASLALVAAGGLALLGRRR